MGGIELGSSDKHTQNHTYPRIARNPELRGIRGGSFMPIKPRLPKDSLLELRDGGRDALRRSDPVQTMFRPIWLSSDSEFRCALATSSYTNMSFLKDSTDVRNMTHYRLILGRRGLSSSNGGRSTDTSATSGSLTRSRDILTTDRATF